MLESIISGSTNWNINAKDPATNSFSTIASPILKDQAS
jgi:hypothetical protein